MIASTTFASRRSTHNTVRYSLDGYAISSKIAALDLAAWVMMFESVNDSCLQLRNPYAFRSFDFLRRKNKISNLFRFSQTKHLNSPRSMKSKTIYKSLLYFNILHYEKRKEKRNQSKSNVYFYLETRWNSAFVLNFLFFLLIQLLFLLLQWIKKIYQKQQQ